MGEEERDARWQALLAIQEDLDAGEQLDASAVMPLGRSTPTNGRRRQRSQKAARFAEALSVSTTWSGIADARSHAEARNRRLSA
jgi:hypothetical protein